jgi:hypothetical protein
MSDQDQSTARPPSWIELNSLIPLPPKKGVVSVKSVTGLSPDTVERRYPDAVVNVSPRRRGMKLGTALAIADGSYRPPTAALQPRPENETRLESAET